MKRLLYAYAAIFTLLHPAATAQHTDRLAAHWEGGVQLPEREMHMVVDLAQNARGEWIGSVSLPDGKIVDAPLRDLSVRQSAVHFAIGFQHDSFEGKLSEDGGGIEGSATSDRGSAPFHLKRTGPADVKLPPASTPLAKELEGNWQGVLELAGQPFRALLRLSHDANGLGVGTLVSVDQDGQEFPITTITQNGRGLDFEIRVIRAKYTGALNAAGTEISGEYAVDAVKLPLVFKRAAESPKR